MTQSWYETRAFACDDQHDLNSRMIQIDFASFQTQNRILIVLDEWDVLSSRIQSIEWDLLSIDSRINDFI
jgi:hypothetical protein